MQCCYTGSLEGADGAGSGKLPYNLADSRCQNFKTCGDEGTDLTGTSQDNADLLSLFDLGAGQLRDGDCAGVRETADQAMDRMYLWVVQGTLRYAYKVRFDSPFSALDNIACLFNLRRTGGIATCPVGLAYATVSCEAVTLHCNARESGARGGGNTPAQGRGDGRALCRRRGHHGDPPGSGPRATGIA